MGEREYSRAQRVGDQLQRELAELIDRELGDPRVGKVTISGVDVSRDLGHARVLVTPAAGVDADASVAALNRATGFLRRRLGSRLRLRYLPRLRFEYDPTLDRANRIDALIAGPPPDGRETGGGR